MLGNRHASQRDPVIDPTEPAIEADDLRVAYERGRNDERRARKRHPVLMSLTVVAALVGGVVIALAAKEGSFAGGGARFDEGVTTAAARAEPVVRGAASEAGTAIKGAGQSVRDGMSPETPADKTG